MNPRTFCQEGDFPWALFLSFAFDPVFFERLVLRDLGYGGSHAVLVLADRGEIDRALRTPSSLIRSLGRSYVLQGAGAGAGWGAFHPKLFLRLGRTGGLAWVGTGNLTHGGWGGNQELASAWNVGPDAHDPGGWVAPLLRRVSRWAQDALAGEILGPMLALDWVRASDGLSEPPFLLTDERPLAEQLAVRWAGRRFHTLEAMTGSTDRTGEMLRWAHRTWGVEHVRLALDPSRAAFDLEGLRKLPVELEIVPQERPPFHAKMYWLDGPDGTAAIVGSPNCSAAAWLRPAAAGGNVEAALVYDDADPQAFQGALERLLRDGSPAANHFPAVRESNVVNAEPPRFRLAALIWDAELARIEARFEGEAPPCEAEVTLVLPDERLALVAEGELWRGPLPEAVALSRAVIGRLEVVMPDGERHDTPPRWLDALHLLRHAIAGRRQASLVERLNRTATGREDDELVEELTALARDLLSDAATFSDPLRALARKPRERPAEGTRLVDAEQLIRSLYDAVVPLAHPLEGAGAGLLGVNGIYQAIFGEEDEGAADAQDDTGEIDNGDAPDPGDDPGEDNEKPERTPEPVAERHRRRFAQHMAKFVNELQSDKFARECTATQLRQAVGYPVAACVLGRDRQWADPEQALEWIKASAGLLLYGHDGAPPLIEAVAERYEGERRQAFEEIVGDGVLWVTLASALVNVPWPGAKGALHRIVLLADLWKADVLRATAPNDRIAALARRHRAEDAVAAIRDVAAPAAATIEELEERLQKTGVDLLTDPTYRPAPVQRGDILWGPKNGLVLATADDGTRNVPVYWVRRGRDAKFPKELLVNVRYAARRDAALAEAFERLLNLIERTLEPEAEPEQEEVPVL